MPENWTGELLGRMHNAGVTRTELADHLHYSYGYVSQIFNSVRARNDPEKRELFNRAFDEIVASRHDS